MTYKEFYTEATKGIDYKTISKSDMQFAYTVFYTVFGESVSKAIESVKLLNSMNGEWDYKHIYTFRDGTKRPVKRVSKLPARINL